MARGRRNGPTPDDHQEPAARAVYREEAGRLVLTNPDLSVAFDATTGTIVSLLHRQTRTELVDAEEASVEGVLWRLEMVAGDGSVVNITNRDATKFAHTVGHHRHEGELRLWLQWSDFAAGAAKVEAVVTAHITFPDDSTTVLFEAEIELPRGIAPRAFCYPFVCSVSSPDPLAEDGIFLPVSGGVYLPDPGSLASAQGVRAWEAGYPGPSSLQLFGYCCGERITMYLTARDPAAACKTLCAAPMPSSSRLRFWITHYPTRHPDDYWSVGYASGLGLVNGDWFEAAREYRAWAGDQPWTARGRGGERILPPLSTAYGLWASHWGGARRAVSAIRELQRSVNVPIKLDWRCWHACARDGAYPDYLPPRDGEEAHARAESQLADAGVLDQANLSALLASNESSSWQADGADVYSFQQDDLPGPLARPVRAPLVAMCPGTAYWREKLTALARAIVERGADGIYLEDLGSALGSSCRQRNHEHGPAAPTQWAASVRALLAAVRTAAGKGRQVATDSAVEPYLDLVDAFLSDHAAAERSSLLPDTFGHRWYPIPLFAAVYHDYTTLVGPAVSLVSHRPHDPLWPRSVMAALREPAPVMQRDYQMQFCLEVARSLTWGYHPLLENFLPEQARDETNRRKLAFLAAGLRAQAWGIGALVPQSQLMGSLAMECPMIEADLLVNPPYSSAAERRSLRRAVQTVHGSAWRVPGGGLALILVNIHTEPVDFAARLRVSRLNLQLPLRMMGRTFSEDGDAPAASLRASGSEIGGKLPGRAIVLISLR